MKPRRSPQLTLRLDAAAPDPLAHWRDGARLAYLGGTLTLRLATGSEAVLRDGSDLHVTLPPEATPRQIRDLAEAWLREEAKRLVGAALESHAARLARPQPRWRLALGSPGQWIGAASDGTLRIHWRLVEQPAEVIDQVIGRSLAALPGPQPTVDLFSAFAH